jgi:hypothetical protein
MVDLSKRLHPGGNPVGVRVKLDQENEVTIMFSRAAKPASRYVTATLSFTKDDIVFNKVETVIILSRVSGEDE